MIAIMRTQTLQSARLHFLKSPIKALKKATAQPATCHSKCPHAGASQNKGESSMGLQQEAESRFRLAMQLMGILKTEEKQTRDKIISR